MKITIHTYKRKTTIKNVDLIQFEKGKLFVYKVSQAHAFRSFYQYDIKFFMVEEKE